MGRTKVPVDVALKANGHFCFGGDVKGPFLLNLFPLYDKSSANLDRCVEKYRLQFKHTFPKDANMKTLRKDIQRFFLNHRNDTKKRLACRRLKQVQATAKCGKKKTTIIEVDASYNPIALNAATRKLVNDFIGRSLDTPNVSGYKAWVDDNKANLEPDIQALAERTGVTTPQHTLGLRRHVWCEAWNSIDRETAAKYEAIAAEINREIQAKSTRKCTKEQLKENQDIMKYAVAALLHNFIGDTANQIGTDAIFIVHAAYRSRGDIVTESFAINTTGHPIIDDPSYPIEDMQRDFAALANELLNSKYRSAGSDDESSDDGSSSDDSMDTDGGEKSMDTDVEFDMPETTTAPDPFDNEDVRDSSDEMSVDKEDIDTEGYETETESDSKKAKSNQPIDEAMLRAFENMFGTVSGANLDDLSAGLVRLALEVSQKQQQLQQSSSVVDNRTNSPLKATSRSPRHHRSASTPSPELRNSVPPVRNTPSSTPLNVTPSSSPPKQHRKITSPFATPTREPRNCVLPAPTSPVPTLLNVTPSSSPRKLKSKSTATPCREPLNLVPAPSVLTPPILPYVAPGAPATNTTEVPGKRSRKPSTWLEGANKIDGRAPPKKTTSGKKGKAAAKKGKAAAKKGKAAAKKGEKSA